MGHRWCHLGNKENHTTGQDSQEMSNGSREENWVGSSR